MQWSYRIFGITNCRLLMSLYYILWIKSVAFISISSDKKHGGNKVLVNNFGVG